jgi:ankyrin repeat protein
MDFDFLLDVVEYDDAEYFMDYAHEATFSLVDKEGENLLHYACFQGCVNVIPLLFQCGINARDKKGRTPLHRVWCGDRAAVVKLLLDAGADINAQDNEGCTLLHRACYIGHLDVVKVLVERGANVNITDVADELLFQELRLQVNCVDMLSKYKDGNTPLHLAALFDDRTDIATLLLDHGANVNAQNNMRATPLAFALETKNEKMAKLLLNRGADPSIRPLQPRWHLD